MKSGCLVYLGGKAFSSHQFRKSGFVSSPETHEYSNRAGGGRLSKF
jgi:hypothetical protein